MTATDDPPDSPRMTHDRMTPDRMTPDRMTSDRDGSDHADSDPLDSSLFADALRQVLEGECPVERVRAIEAGESPAALWRILDGAGFADALVAETAGGAGLVIGQLADVWAVCGHRVLPLPLPETMVARGLLAAAGLDYPAGPIALAEGFASGDGGLHCPAVAFGRVADAVLVEVRGEGRLLPVAAASAATPAACVLDQGLAWDDAAVAAAPTVPIRSTARSGSPKNSISSSLRDAARRGAGAPASAGPGAVPTLRLLAACTTAATLAGTLLEVFRRTLDYANERRQFGRPIGRFQAIQHQLAVMSEHVFAARMAARLGCAGAGLTPDPLRVAVAKARCSQAAAAVADGAHSIHGAIGITEEFDLQLFTRRLHAGRRAAGSEGYWQAVAGAALVGWDGSTLDLTRQVTDVE